VNWAEAGLFLFDAISVVDPAISRTTTWCEEEKGQGWIGLGPRHRILVTVVIYLLGL
jgi:hypothetical protein